MAKNKKNTKVSKFEKALGNVLKSLIADGRTYAELAQLMGIAESTFRLWRHGGGDLSTACKSGRDVATGLVETALFKRAMGYSHPEEKVHYDSNTGEWVTKTIMKHYPPSESALKIWLYNKERELWYDKENIELSGDQEKPLRLESIKGLSNEELLREIKKEIKRT